MEEHSTNPTEPVRLNSLDDHELAEAITLYAAKVKADIFRWADAEHGIKITDPKLKGTLSFFMGLAISRGMEIGADPSTLIAYHRLIKSQDPSIFKEGQGVSGVLLPNGDFLNDTIEEDMNTISTLLPETNNLSIFFTSQLDGTLINSTIIYSHKYFNEATPQQKDWMVENKIFFDEGQTNAFLAHQKNNKF